MVDNNKPDKEEQISAAEALKALSESPLKSFVCLSDAHQRFINQRSSTTQINLSIAASLARIANVLEGKGGQRSNILRPVR